MVAGETHAHDDAIITVDGLRAAYGKRVILDDVSFTVGRGEIFVIMGGSGSGKSTLLKHLIGLNRPAQGRILIDGDDLVGADRATRSRILSKIGVGYQSGALFGSMTVLENVRLPMEEFTRLPASAQDVIARLKLGLVGLEDFAELMPSELSGGMQKRAAIARAMALDPMILFLDEPSAGLDPITSAELDRLIIQLRDSLGVTFVVVSHELASIYTIADRVIVLDPRHRNIAAEGPPGVLRDASDVPWVRRFFNREPEGEPGGKPPVCPGDAVTS